MSKAATQFKAPFYGKDEEVNIILKKGDTVDLGMDEYFYNDIGSLKVSCTKGKLPDGLAIDKKRSEIKGIPTATGTTAVTLQGVDEMGRKATIKVNFCIYDETTIASGNQSDEIAWTHSKAEAAAAQVAANATRLDVDKRDDIADYYVKCYSIAPQGGSGNYTFTLDTPDNADVRLSTDKIAKKGVFMSFQAPEEIPGISCLNFLKVAKNKIDEKPVKIFEFKDSVKNYAKELNMNANLIDRNLNVGFSGGEKKKNEILQMLVLNPKLAILDETDSGLDVDAIKAVSKGIEMYKSNKNSILIITHNMSILESLDVDFVHVLVDGKIVKTGNFELAKDILENGFSKYKEAGM